MKPTPTTRVVALIAAWIVSSSAALPAADDFAAQREEVLALGKLTTPPAIHPLDGVASDGGLKALFFDALPWKGKPTRVFAWVGLPQSREGRVPGIVLVHGGGGTAYKEWVRKWTEHGYAALSIAVEGQTDEPNDGRPGAPRGWKRHEWAGPQRQLIYADSAETLRDQWMYHAVADTVLANSLLRSLPEVNAEKIGVMGISWGGVIASTVIGIDSRFAFAVPTYGCGHLGDAANQWGAALGDNRLYREVWDPMVRFHRVTMPVLWFSWPGDSHFPLDCQAASYRATPGPRMIALLPGMRHGHAPAWNPPESYAFAESVVRTGQPWCQQTGARLGQGVGHVTFSSQNDLDRAVLISTVDAGFTGNRKWTESPAGLKKQDGEWRVTAPLPQGTTSWFVNVRSGGLTASSEYQTVPVGPAHGAAAPPLENSFERYAKPFLKQYCVRCHNAEKLTSGIRVDHLDATLEARHLRLWKAVRAQIREEAMPPEEETQPTSAERQRMVEWIGQALDLARARPTPKNGLVRRLTVSQYRNTLRELLLLEDDLTERLPPDAVSRDGFVNNTETLQLSPLHLEAYFEIAEEALKRCLVEPESRPTIQNFRVDLGTAINPDPCRDKLILGADSLLLNNEDFIVTQLTPRKSFDFELFAMRTKYRFNEGYEGNATVRGWREYDSIYHAVFACMRGSHGYPKGDAYSVVPEGLLLRPAIPNDETFHVDGTYGPKANFKISLRELPDHGRFRVTVTAAKYQDGLVLDRGTPAQPADGPDVIVCRDPNTPQVVTIPEAGVYQVDVPAAARGKAQHLMLTLGDRHFSGPLQQAAFLAVRLPAGELQIRARYADAVFLERIVLTPLGAQHELAKQFSEFEKRSPRLSVHLGLRRDCGSTLAPVGSPQTASSTELSRYVFEGAVCNFPSPDVEKDNVNYLAGIREIGVRSEYTDGRDIPRLLIRSVEFEGPFYDAWPPTSHRNLFIDYDHKEDRAAYARLIIRAFATRAYRRPIAAAEESALMEVFEESSQRGNRFQESVQDALQVVLTSPQFLFLIETSQAPEAERLDDHELASKLAYFLWNGPPDESLLRLAGRGVLGKQVEAEVDRMIDDPRFARFVGEFTSQWLALDKFQVLEPDRTRFPRLTRAARAHLKQEPAEYLQHLIRHNLGVKNLIESDFVVVNEVVASYYDLAEKPESGFQFLPIPHRRPELGGILTQAAILAGLSDGRESNPVKRGAWLARRIIAEPPDDPPPNVPALKEDMQQRSLRERLERHRNQPGCVQCHSKVDPWGIPLEQFDAGGRLKNLPVDARSTLPDETEVGGIHDLKRYLAKDRIDQVAFSVLKHLAIYATGRSLTDNELEYLKREGVKLKPNGYRMREMIRFVVTSPIFLEK